MEQVYNKMNDIVCHTRKQKIKRTTNVISTCHYFLIQQDHFDETQYESHRADKLHKLRPFVVPSLFGPNAKRMGQDPKRSSLQKLHWDVIRQIARPGVEEKVKQDHTYSIPQKEPPTDPAQGQSSQGTSITM